MTQGGPAAPRVTIADRGLVFAMRCEAMLSAPSFHHILFIVQRDILAGS